MNGLCDICDIRPATHRVQVTQNGQMAELNVCDIDYQRLRQQAGSSSPFESLFSGSNPFNSFEQAFARPGLRLTGHGAVRLIAHPAAKPKLPRRLLRPGAEPHALHSARHAKRQRPHRRSSIVMTPSGDNVCATPEIN